MRAFDVGRQARWRRPGGRRVTLLDATQSAALVRAGVCSPRQLVMEALARIDAGNAALNAIIHRRDEQALADADARAGGWAVPRRAYRGQGLRLPRVR